MAAPEKSSWRRENQETSTGFPFGSVLIVDEQPLYCDALANLIWSLLHPRLIFTATNLRSAVRLLSTHRLPMLIFLNLGLPEVAGISGFFVLKRKAPGVPIIINSAIASAEVIQAAFEAGAAGFIPKSAPKEELEKGIGAVSSGQRFFPKKLTGPSGDARSPNRLRDISDRISRLTPQQMRILKLICQGKLNKQIAFDLNLAETTVKTHITALMRRLSVQNRTQAALLFYDASIQIQAP